MRYATAYFPTFGEACKYYLPYGFFSFHVQNKIYNGEIHIGKPPTTEFQQAVLIDENPGLRYYIVEEVRVG